MNPMRILTGILSCLLLMLTITHSYGVLGNRLDDDDDHHEYSLIDQPSALSGNKAISILQNDNSDEHELEKRRFYAWAGKRALLTKRRFYAWAGR